MLLYGYCTGVASSRRIARRLREDIAFRVLAANNNPDFRTVSDFRKDHLAALADLFGQVLALCQRAGLVKLGHVALDGTKVKANASRNKAMSYARMKEKEERLAAEVEELLRRAQEVDDEEDRRYGRDQRGDELPEELAFRESRLRKIREAKAALEAEAREAAEQAESEDRNHPGVPEDKAQRNFTDPDSRIMPGPGGRDFQQAYNCQAVVDSAHQVIVAARATNQASDKQQAVAMVVEAIGNIGLAPREVSADAGYYSAKAVEELYALGVDPFIAPDQTRHGRVLPPAPQGRIPKHLSARDRMRRKLRTKRGRAALRPADGDDGAGIRPDQAGAGIPAVPAEEPGEGEPGVAANLHRAQPAQAVPVRGQSTRQSTRQRPHWEHQGDLQDREQLDFRETIRPSASATGRNGRRQLTPANLLDQLGNPRTPC